MTLIQDLSSKPEISLEDLWREDFSGFSARAKFRLVESLAVQLWNAHAANRTLPAAALRAILVHRSGDDVRIRLNSRGRVVKVGNWRIRDLSRLYSQLLPAVSRNLGFRFLRSYFDNIGELNELLAIGEQVDRIARRKAARRWKRAEDDCLRSARGFVAGKTGGRRYYRRDSIEAEMLLKDLLADPDKLMQNGERLPGRGNSCLTVKIESAGRSYVLKRYNRRGWIYSFRHVFRRSRALRGWIASWGFRARGIPVPDPILCLEEKCFRFLGHSYIVSRYLECTSTLGREWESLAGIKKKRCLIHLAVLFGQLHRLGAIHGDTNWDNILVDFSPRRCDFFLIDMDCSRVYGRPRDRKVKKDIMHVFRDLDRLSPADIELKRLFRDCWERWSGVKNHSENISIPWNRG